MSLTESLKWRYAVKKYSDKKVSEADINTIIEAINLSASSAGLQPYRVIVVESPKIRKKLGEGAFNPQITEASHLLVFAAIENLSIAHVDEYMQRMAQTRGVPVESLEKFRQLLIANITGKTQEENFTWAAKQAYIGLGTGIAAASELQVDTTPMEGFIPSKFDDILGLKEKGLKSVVLLALGYRDADKDPYAQAAKVRLPMDVFSSSL
ncbi:MULTISPECIES: NAD(P)H-dependent oxidoreductase [unclassified Spirosoma]|uniref:NAD(P)H-dependent oxidoreductase n=1 Tax=unclassified Spirosoma TaxID=2621999 RepID=UPI00096219BC|nr:MULTISPECIES: NAD(P)H-dependent oxidoreductase [unclassified Spirosoma]MBN8824308.1 NAD(P)H-dependent oxidoreductase [Spirosoma sp.]OJW70220.1 MAG: NAD(P)H-dependent oxidoreductase [Spirosoma sp. 48-14]